MSTSGSLQPGLFGTTYQTLILFYPLKQNTYVVSSDQRTLLCFVPNVIFLSGVQFLTQKAAVVFFFFPRIHLTSTQMMFLTLQHYDANSSNTENCSGTKQQKQLPLDMP